jgi:hypothetical protein
MEQPSATQSDSVKACGERHVPRAGLREKALRSPMVQEVTGLGHVEAAHHDHASDLQLHRTIPETWLTLEGPHLYVELRSRRIG